MQLIDHQNQLNETMMDPDRKIPKDHLDNICLLHSGAQTCRYIGLSVNGFVCVKHSPVQATLDEKVEDGKLKACGDNCGGLCPPK